MSIREFGIYLNKTSSKNTAVAYTSKVALLFDTLGVKGEITQEIIDAYFNSHQLKITSQAGFVAAARKYNKFIGADALINTVKPVYDFAKQKALEENPLDFNVIKKYLASNYKESRLRLRDKALIYFMYYAGLRVSEVSDLSWDDVQGDFLCVRAKKSIERFVFINTLLMGAINEYKRSLDYENPYVFASFRKGREGEMLTYGAARYIIGLILKECGYESQSSHVFRYLFITNLFKNGAYISGIKRVSGHSNYGDLDHYYIGERTADEAVAMVDGVRWK